MRSGPVQCRVRPRLNERATSLATFAIEPLEGLGAHPHHSDLLVAHQIPLSPGVLDMNRATSIGWLLLGDLEDGGPGHGVEAVQLSLTQRRGAPCSKSACEIITRSTHASPARASHTREWKSYPFCPSRSGFGSGRSTNRRTIRSFPAAVSYTPRGQGIQRHRGESETEVTEPCFSGRFRFPTGTKLNVSFLAARSIYSARPGMRHRVLSSRKGKRPEKQGLAGDRSDPPRCLIPGRAEYTSPNVVMFGAGCSAHPERSKHVISG